MRQSFAKIGLGTSKNLWWEIKEDKTRPKYNSLPLSLERYAGDCNYKPRTLAVYYIALLIWIKLNSVSTVVLRTLPPSTLFLSIYLLSKLARVSLCLSVIKTMVALDLTPIFKYASTNLHYHVALLLPAVVCYGSVPNDFLFCTTIPMPNGNTNSNRTVSGNYRDISLSSVFGRLIDLLILHRYSDVLGTCDLQFGFKSKRSTANLSDQ